MNSTTKNDIEYQNTECQNIECIICYETYNINNDKMLFFSPICGCNISTHYKCGIKWLNKNAKCPQCATLIDINNVYTNNQEAIYELSNSVETDTPDTPELTQSIEPGINIGRELFIGCIITIVVVIIVVLIVIFSTSF